MDQSLSRSTHLSLHIHKDPAAMAERAAHIFAAACEEAIAERGNFTVALSGGVSPIPLFELLRARDWADRIPWDKTTVFWADERCVAPDHDASNYGMARRELLGHVPATHFFRIRGDRPPEEAALRYEKQLREEFGLADKELPRFDLVILGMGKDGHTASLFPEAPELSEKKRLAVDVYMPSGQPDRITLTLPVLNNARRCMFLVNGADKHAALGKVLNLLQPPSLPAQMVRPLGGELVWIVDEASATGNS